MVQDAPDAGDVSASTSELLARARACARAGELREAEQLFEEVLCRVELLQDDALIAAIHLENGELRLRKGEHGAARASAVVALEIFNRLGHALARAIACRLLGVILRETGAIELAELRLREAAIIAEQSGAAMLAGESLCELARLYRSEGRFREAVRALNRAHPLIRSVRAGPPLADAVAERLAELETLYLEVAREWGASAGSDPTHDHDHSHRVSRLAAELARELGLPRELRLPVEIAACLREIGGAAEPLTGLGFPWDLASLVGHRHPRSDRAGGRGGPKRADLPLGARIIALADAADRLLSPGADHPPLSPREALARLEADRDAFDPVVLDALRRIDWDRVREERARSSEDQAAPDRGEPTCGDGVEAAPSRERRRILIVDDDPDTREMLSRFLDSRGFAVEALGSGDGLFGVLSRLKPDLLLLDVLLPGRDGRALLQRLRASPRWADVPVIMITGLNDPAVAANALRGGADDYMEKPLDFPALLARIERLLGIRQALGDAERRASRQELLLEIIRELAGSLDSRRIMHLLVRRVAEAIGVGKCSLILARPGAATGRLVAAYDNPNIQDLEVQLERYPEIVRALDTGEVVLVDVLHEDPLLDAARRRWEAAVHIRSSAVIPLVVESDPVGAFFVRTTSSEPPLERAAVDFATEVARAAGKALEYARLFERISAELTAAQKEADAYRTLSLTDPLTGVANRAALDSVGARLFVRACALHHPLSLLMLDVDDFKRINDTYGHAAGDDVLRELATILCTLVSDRDLVVRYGGDEFCLVLPERDIDEASRIGRTMCQKAAELRPAGLHGASPALSVGVASYPALVAATLPQLIAQADAALYRAKRAGGGRSQLALGAGLAIGGGAVPTSTLPL